MGWRTFASQSFVLSVKRDTAAAMWLNQPPEEIDDREKKKKRAVEH